ncbi:hypothetical protein AVEN_196813-1 [Araneus ventricosus]|uniref:Uncharacterized protein n=1 Tax=Araneus ventricosus TaxID=182803 RepID=A0A4Y2JG90_ARAVE|nr:hypothetical protein AVEN_196813-1 [Araneus ventricosus]
MPTGNLPDWTGSSCERDISKLERANWTKFSTWDDQNYTYIYNRIINPSTGGPSVSPLTHGLFGSMRGELDSSNLGGHLPHHCYKFSLRRSEMDSCPSAKIIGPPTSIIFEAILEPHLSSKEANRLRLAFVDVKSKFLDRPEPPSSM